ncbi:YlbF/YmcA family competence regulator [Streptococcus uberis]|uniref:YlbF/YmcA family competence regulator n=1 Tax=Streptococcus uberis TaxID=1349 RepID=UPI0012B5228D|nr:YlbF/YmcA family competence regulator [Streptococcus uberis]MTC88646.1 YlbF/YmcA family competence regulator [Streptococcus uberis]
MTQEIYEYANKIERALRNLPEYKKVVAAKEDIEKDSEASNIFEEFFKLQAKLKEMIQNGQTLSNEEQETIHQLSSKIESNELLKAYFEAQQSLSVYINDIERIIFNPLKDLI